MKTVIVGGASITWMPTFLNDLSRTVSMAGGTLVLHDIDEEHQNIIAEFGRKLFSEVGAKINIIVEKDLDKALQGADFVVCTVLIGGHDAWLCEMNLILSYGIEHPKGMSVGPGGFAMGIKQIPFILGLAKKMERICPKAWLLNFSNPMQVITMAVQKYSKIKFLGLCHGVTHTVTKMAAMINKDEDQLFYKIGGVNHFEVMTTLQQDGQDLMPEVADKFEQTQWETTYWSESEKITTENYRIFGAYQCNEDIHGIEYWPHYIRKGVHVGDFGLIHNYIENRLIDRNKKWESIRQYNENKLPLSEIVSKHSTEKLELIINGITKNEPTYLYANVMNDGFVENIDRDVCVEVPLVLFREGYIGCNIGKIPRGFAVISNVHGAVQAYIVEAALNGDRHAALKALTLDPMCYSLSLHEREKLINELIDISSEWLPAFH